MGGGEFRRCKLIVAKVQLSFVFADSPEGSGQSTSCGAPQAGDWLLHEANGKEFAVPAAQADGADGRAEGPRPYRPWVVLWLAVQADRLHPAGVGKPGEENPALL